MFENIILVIVGIIVLIILSFFLLVAKSHKKVAQGHALIRTGMGGAKVALDSGMFVIPVLHKLETMNISLKTVTIEFLNENGLICKDYLRADIKTTFYVRVNTDKRSIIEVAQTIGCAQASTQETLDRLFKAKFTEVLLTVAKQFDFEELSSNLDQFKVRILNAIGTDLNGYILDDLATDYLAQTSIKALKPEHITDAKAIKIIEEATAAEMIEVNRIIRKREQVIKKQDMEAREVMLALELEEAKKDAQHKKEMDEINTVKNKSDSIYDRL